LPRLTWKPSWVSLILMVIIIALTVTYCTVPRPNAIGFNKLDWILVCDLENNTNEEIFDNSLIQALIVTIDQSKYVNIFPKNQVSAVLQRMKMDSVDKIDTPVALEIAQRENIKGVLSLSISEMGDSYLICTNLINASTGVTIQSRKVEAKGKEDIFRAMDHLASKVRKDLGEALNQIQFHTVALPKATTSSLDALKCLAEANIAWTVDTRLDVAEKLFLEAIDLDPEFALAHAELGSLYYWTNNRDKGEEHFEKAMSLVDRLTEKEKLFIEARIANFRGNWDDAALKYEMFLRQYPGSPDAWFSLGYCLFRLDRYEEAIEAFNRSLEINPYQDPNSYINIASCYSLMKRYQQSIDYYLKAFELNPKLIANLGLNHEFGFTYVHAGEIDKAREVFEKLMSGNDEQKARGLRSQALLSMYQGKLSEAISRMQESNQYYGMNGFGISQLRNHMFLAIMYRTKGMISEYSDELYYVNSVIGQYATEPYWFLLLGKLFVRSGDIDTAERLLEALSEKVNEGNKDDESAFRQLKGEIELAKGNNKESITLLEDAVKLRKDSFTLESLGNYYYKTGQTEKAISVFEDITGPYYSLGWEGQECSVEANYRLAIIYEEIGDHEKAIKYFHDFIDRWKEADDDLPMLMDAKSRLENLETL